MTEHAIEVICLHYCKNMKITADFKQNIKEILEEIADCKNVDIVEVWETLEMHAFELHGGKLTDINDKRKGL